MPIDLSKLHEDAKTLETPPKTPAIEPASPSDVAAARRSLQEQRGALNAEAAPPGQEPVADPIDRALHAGRQFPRGSDQAVQAYMHEIVQAVVEDDPRVMAHGVADDKTRRQWHEDAHARQISNRDESGATHR